MSSIDRASRESRTQPLELESSATPADSGREASGGVRQSSAVRRGDEPAITPPRILLSAAALEKVREMLEEEDLLEEGGLRLSARPGAGCSAPTRFGMVLDADADPDDVVLEGNGIRIFMDPNSAWSLDGLMVDYTYSPTMGEGFSFQLSGGGGRSC